MAVADATIATPALPETIRAIIQEDAAALDPDAERFLPLLRSRATEIWHKHGNFYNHLHDVWEMLCTWKQPRAICRLGLFHSAYSNSFVSMNLWNADDPKERQALRDLIGEEAENLVWKFCVIDRQEMEDNAISTGAIPATGRTLRHIRSGEPVHCSAAEIGAFLVETVADYMDQSFGWQSDMEAGKSQALWPGLGKPTLRMSKVAKIAKVARSHGQLEVVPPVFDAFAADLEDAAEREARDLYWRVLTADEAAEGAGLSDAAAEAALADLRRSSELNPFVAEPHTLRAQLLVQRGRWQEAAEAADAALQIFYQWATQWDKRMPFGAWVAWTRCILLQAACREWPTTHGGVESLGAVHPSQRFRRLNDSRNFIPPAAEVEQASTEPAAKRRKDENEAQ